MQTANGVNEGKLLMKANVIFLTLTQGHLNIKMKIMVFSEITWFGNYCSLIMRPETLQMQTTYDVNKGV